MPIKPPDAKDADLIFKAYDLRREAVIRESRSALVGKFNPANYEEFLKITQFDHPLNAAWRQVTGYWEMVYSFARHGVVNPDFWVENNGEGIFLFCKFAPYIERWKKEVAPTAFTNTLWVIENTEEGKKRFDRIKAMFAKMAEAKK